MIKKRIKVQFINFALILSMLLSIISAGLMPVQVYALDETVLYVNAEGSGEMDGSSAANAMTLRNAYAQIAEQGETDVTRIIVCGPVLVKDHLELVTGKTTEYYFPKHAGKVILTGEGDGAGLNFEKLSFYFQGDTTVEQIAILEKANNVYADYQPLHLGENVTGTFASTVYLGTTYAMFKMGTVTIGDAEFSMKSGTITKLYGGGSYYQGSALAGRKYTISLELSGGTVTTLYGSGLGATDCPGHKSIRILVNGGTITTLYGAHSSATVDEDIQIVLESGTVGTVYGACEFTGDALPNYTPTIHNVEIEVGNAAVTSLNAEMGNANITGSKILHYRNASGANMASGSGFDTLKLTNSSVTVPSGMAAIWNGITSLSLTDNSVLTLAETPAVAEKSVAVTAVRSGTEWNTSGAVILAPAGTPDIFTLASPTDCELVYASDADGASWTLKELAEFPIGEKTGTEAKTMDIALNLPDGTNYTLLEADATAYETYLAKLQDLEAVGAKDEVRVISPVEIKGEIALYVAPNGNDENSGSKDAPVATIAKALQLVESIQELVDPPKGIIVYLRAGTYVANEPITLGKVHSGVNGMPVIISAYADEEVVITGGTDIDGSHFQAVQEVSAEAYQKLPVAVRDRVVAVKLGDLGISEFGSISGGVQGGPNYQIFVDGEELTLARYPNAENLSLTGNVLHVGAITATSSVLGPQGTNADDPDVRFEMTDLRPTLWENDGNIWLKGALYAEWDITNIRVKDIDSENGVMRLDGGCGYGARKMVTNTYYYYNILEELDIPGEYYLDTANGILYLVPIGDMAEATVTFSAMQNNLINLNQTENVVLNGLTIENCAKYGIYMNNCTQTLVQNCVIRNVGTGVRIHGTKSGVIYSDIEGIANRPVEISQSQTVFDYTPELNFLQNCYIHSTGTKNEKYCGVYVQGTGNVVSHNLVQGTFSVAIYVMFAKECIVEYNEITGGPTGTYDGGAIYQPYHPSDTGNHIRYNYIHDIAAFSDKHNPCAIYFDEGLTGNFAYGNIMSNLPCGFFTNSGSENVIVHNVVMDGRAGTQSGIRGESNFTTYSIAQRFARAPYMEKVYQKYVNLPEAEKAEIKARYPLQAKRYEDIQNALNNGEDGVGLFIAKDNYVHNNLVYNCGGISFVGQNHDVGDNIITNVNPFTNPAGHDFSLNGDVSVPFIDQIPSMDRIGVITEQKQGIDAFRMYAPQNGDTKVNPFQVLLKWTNGGGADTYELKISKYADMHDARTFVLEQRYYILENDAFFEYDTDYYWTVTAYTTAKSRIDTPVAANNGAVFSFRTMTRAEYVASYPIDTSKLEETITEAENLLLEIREISDGGLYSNGTAAALQEAIDDARSVLENAEELEQADINKAQITLKNAIRTAKGKQPVLYRYVTFDRLDPQDWSDPSGKRASAAVSEDELQLTVESGSRSQSVYAPGLGVQDILCFRFKLDALKSWNGFALAQSDTNYFITALASTDGYFICIKEDVIELQKRFNSKNYGNIAVVTNNNEIMTGGEWYDIQVAALNNADGSVRIYFAVNGQIVFDYLDETDAISGETGFGVVLQPYNTNGYAHIMKADLSQLPKADYTALDAELALKPANGETTYTAESWAAYQVVLASVEEISRDLTPLNQQMIDDLTDGLRAAREALVNLPKADYTALDAELALKPANGETTYTAESWAAYQAVLNRAENLSRDLTELDQQIVDDLTNELKAAREALVRKPVEPSQPDNPNTGDSKRMTIWLLLLIIAASLCGCFHPIK